MGYLWAGRAQVRREAAAPVLLAKTPRVEVIRAPRRSRQRLCHTLGRRSFPARTTRPASLSRSWCAPNRRSRRRVQPLQGLEQHQRCHHRAASCRCACSNCLPARAISTAVAAAWPIDVALRACGIIQQDARASAHGGIDVSLRVISALIASGKDICQN